MDGIVGIDRLLFGFDNLLTPDNKHEVRVIILCPCSVVDESITGYGWGTMVVGEN